jgi:hypothetical protein
MFYCCVFAEILAKVVKSQKNDLKKWSSSHTYLYGMTLEIIYKKSCSNKESSSNLYN